MRRKHSALSHGWVGKTGLCQQSAWNPPKSILTRWESQQGATPRGELSGLPQVMDGWGLPLSISHFHWSSQLFLAPGFREEGNVEERSAIECQGRSSSPLFCSILFFESRK